MYVQQSYCLSWKNVKFFTVNNLGSDGDTPHLLPILELIHKITQAIERKEYTLTVFIDLSKAFDIIDHSIFFK